MSAKHDPLGVVRSLDLADGRTVAYHSLPALAQTGVGDVNHLPVCLRVVLEALARTCDDRVVTQADVRALAAWQPNAVRTAEVPFVVARILLQDFTGVPLLVDLAAMRSVAARMGRDPKVIEPLVPVDLVVDHSVQVDYHGFADALARNMEMEFTRNATRYQFLKWGTQAFESFRVVPPGVGIVHQVNLERLATCVVERDGTVMPDTLVGTDSHTTMVNGLGVVAWGVGGIEAEAGMLGQPVYFLTPDVTGVNLTGTLRPGVTATDLVLTVTEVLRRAGVVGRFVEFHGEGAASLAVADRATIANMAPEYGATMGYFAPDEATCSYLLATGRDPILVETVRRYYEAQGLFGTPPAGKLAYTTVIDLDLADIEPSVAGPRRPQDRLALGNVAHTFRSLLTLPPAAGGYGIAEAEVDRRYLVQPAGPGGEPRTGGGEQEPATAPEVAAPQATDEDTNPHTEVEMMENRPTPNRVESAAPGPPPGPPVLRHGSVVIAAITSCTNTSNPAVMLTAGLLARRAVERGLTLAPGVKASLAPGSRVVTDYLNAVGLSAYLDRLGFATVGYGCTTCIGNSGPLDPAIEQAVTANGLVVAAVLSGNRNFEARVHQVVRANYLMSPPLVVAYALAGRIDVDLSVEPVGADSDGVPVYLRDLWPTPEQVADTLAAASRPEAYRRLYADDAAAGPLWQAIATPQGDVYGWDAASTYIQEPPYFDRFGLEPEPAQPVRKARALAILGDSVTTDHISPAGAIRAASPAGAYLIEHGVAPEDFNTYGARRGNDRVMVRGTFANVRIRNLMAPGTEGGVTAYQPGGEVMPIYDAAVRYQAAGIPLLVFAGAEYGTGSSRDWAAKGARLLGVRAVVAVSFERIHRSNLAGMGVLPCQFPEGVDAQSLRLNGTETFDLDLGEGELKPRQTVTLQITRADGSVVRQPLILRIDTPVEAEYYREGGILPFVLRRILRDAAHERAPGL